MFDGKSGKIYELGITIESKIWIKNSAKQEAIRWERPAFKTSFIKKL